MCLVCRTSVTPGDSYCDNAKCHAKALDQIVNAVGKRTQRIRPMKAPMVLVALGRYLEGRRSHAA
jgi:hypothetical protein